MIGSILWAADLHPVFLGFSIIPGSTPQKPCFFLFVSSVLKRLRCLRWCVFHLGSKFLFKRKCWLFIFLVGFLPQVFFRQKNPTSRRMGFWFFGVWKPPSFKTTIFGGRTCLTEVYWRSWSQSTVGIFTPSKLAFIL